MGSLKIQGGAKNGPKIQYGDFLAPRGDQKVPKSRFWRGVKSALIFGSFFDCSWALHGPRLGSHLGPFWVQKWCRNMARTRSPKRTPSGSRFEAKFGPKLVSDHFKNVDFVSVFVLNLRNRPSEPAGRDGDREWTKMEPKIVHFGAQKRLLWGPDSGARSGPVSGPIWVAIWAVWGPILERFWGPIWGPFRGRFSVPFSVAVWGGPGATWGPRYDCPAECTNPVA